MALVGYARVSTQDQDTRVQSSALRAAGVRDVVSETRSGAEARPALEALLTRLQPGDVLIVYKVDRLARSLADLLRVLQAVTSAGATFRSLTEPLETATPAGRMMVQMLGAFAEFERAIIRERCAAGMAEARRAGVRFGRPPILTSAQRAECADLARQGATLSAIARRFGIHPDTVRRAIAKA
ncbi:recombinase family protein [Pseudaquabacterium rugosum]|uniref:Recombinase family protein n=1 Tax=Pseudaquabacterium rugosum TaxID=2984194 RepID=A0ABU9BEX9_9BURK